MRLLVLVLLFATEIGRAASPAPVAARSGMVVTAHELATRIGVEGVTIWLRTIFLLWRAWSAGNIDLAGP